ncbi:MULTISPECIES: thiolase family protein [Neobacillus]|uniref:propanoyl-CoA C-acyltransferase n=1 Tax=Neobacillus rhizophilus TaxID=2833579 RepID=A0A942YWM1_9BACI|nr:MULTISPECIES: thiolase family protein [Neobacillus]MBS4215127.1 thiolase family protein [Neobacillus rhizophilus]
MRDVAVIGMGMTPFGKFPETPISKLGYTAIIEALKDSGIEKQRIEAAFIGSVYGEMGIGQKILMEIGLTGIPVTNVENACASGSSAFREAWLQVSMGAIDVALAVGIEQLSTSISGPIPLNLEDYEVSQGLILPAQYALMSRRYMDRYGITEEQLAQVSVKNHYNGTLNPKSQYRKKMTLEEIMSSRPIADPIKLLECCPIGDGAAAAILVSKEYAKKLGISNPVCVKSSVLMSGDTVYEPEESVWSQKLINKTVSKAYEDAGLGPNDIDFAEVHDAYPIAELLAYEGLQFCKPGDSGKLLSDGVTELTGAKPVNTSGGLLSKGHPLAATGVAQLYEIYLQLHGRAENRQIERNGKLPLVGVAETMGGGGISNLSGNICSIIILAR